VVHRLKDPVGRSMSNARNIDDKASNHIMCLLKAERKVKLGSDDNVIKHYNLGQDF